LSESALLLVVAVFGLAIGSFLNVVIHRLPRMMENEWKAQCAELAGAEPEVAGPRYNLVVPGSHCPHCRTPLRVIDNIPLVSWVALRGKCGHCGTRISARYPVVEALTAVLSAMVAYRFGFTPATLLALAFTWTLVALTFIDADTTLLPDDLTLPLLWLGLGSNVFGTFVPLQDAVIGAMAGYLVLWSIYWLFKLATGKEGMGYGDFKLLAAIGAWLGWQALLPIVLASSIIGAAVGIAMKIAGALREGRFVPFGPFLAGGGIAVMLVGTKRALDWLGWV
jgi:leader peptidase (prepilin peptidase) / N-methyltransferase